MEALHLLNSLKHGGGENVAFNYAQVLATLNVSSTFVGRTASEEYERMISPMVKISHKLSGGLIRKSDLVFVHSNVNLLRLLAFRLLPLGWKHKKIVYIQHLNYPLWKFRLLAVLINLLCTDFIRITPVTEKQVSRYIRVKTHFIVNFYLNKYPEKEWTHLKNDIRAELAIDPAQTVVTFSAVFKPGKNVGEFIALADAMKQRKDMTFLLIGDGPEADLVRSYHGDNLIWLGFVNDVERYLIASDIYMFLSKFEMLPMALLEAVNTDKRIIAYKTPINDFVLAGRTYDAITPELLFDSEIPCGAELMKYDRVYARRMLAELIQL